VTDEKPDPNEPTPDPLGDAVRASRFAALPATEAPSAHALLSAVGGVRGLVESILPSLVFLIVYLITKDVVPSVLIPVGIALVFIVARVGAKSPTMPAITGAVGVGIAAVLALVSGDARNNFVPGLLINAAGFVVMLGSLIARFPLIGFVVGTLLGDAGTGWRSIAKQRRAMTIATWVWVGLFGIRLAVEVPLYVLNIVDAQAVAKLVLGVPLYVVVLWITWILVRSAFAPEPPPVDNQHRKLS
jgi:hypothetical protein